MTKNDKKNTNGALAPWLLTKSGRNRKKGEVSMIT